MSKNKVTHADIKNIMVNAEVHTETWGSKTTIVSVTLANGFVITESSSCVDSANYDAEIGKAICLDRIERKLWELEGYKLQCEVAERAARAVIGIPTGTPRTKEMSFGKAINALKAGLKVARSGWNDKGMFIYLVEGTTIPQGSLRNEAKKHYPTDGPIVVGMDLRDEALAKENTVIINSHIDMKAADGSIVVGWLASQTDMLAEDWEVVS